ncbi:uncharacterized protein [Onthophagus taurus]|uniref:uncharacterized protein n=1 Tax=Onthophagus taurus TaxID=166361 RepID=UPI0039BE32BF
MYRGQDPQIWFIEQLKLLSNELYLILKAGTTNRMHPMTRAEKNAFHSTNNCPICFCNFTNTNPKVKHHDHFTGKFISPLCSNCNLQIKVDYSIPIFFHNLSGYDVHLFVLELAKNYEINVIPVNHETYISLSVKINQIKFVFLDSYRFMSASLSELVGNLKTEQLIHTKAGFPNPQQFKLTTRKGVYPYDYIDNFDKFNETCLPEQEKFFSILANEGITDDDYSHALDVWNTFDCKTLGDYSDLYLKTDVLLLCDVFENFRNLTINHYGLDAAAFYTAPGLSWAASLKSTHVKLELLKDIDMILFIEKGIRGGITQSIHRYAKANNPYDPNNFDGDPFHTYLMYWDATNLYGWAQSQYMPINEFSWLYDTNFNVLNVADDSEYGYIVEADLSVPRELHDFYSDFPLLPEHIKPPNSSILKLLCTLNNKFSYIIHYINLKQAVKLGIKIDNVKRILKFRQSPWLKQFIDLNTKLRMKADNEFDKNFFKLIINAHFGKTMENDRKKRKIVICNNWRSARKYISKPEFKCLKIFSENIVSIELEKTEIIFNKPIYIGFTVLELSKTLMYSFHYDFVKQILDSKFHVQLMYMDTDSLIYKFKCKLKNYSIYDAIRDNIDLFDTSDLSSNNIWKIPSTNKKVPGKFKDECKGDILTEFIALRAKVYTLKINNKEISPKVKGIGRTASKLLTFKDFENALFNDSIKLSNFNSIRSNNHQLYSVNINKISLSSNDDKRFISSDTPIITFPWGHYKL